MMGISVFNISTDGSLTNTYNVQDNASLLLQLEGVNALAIADINSIPYLFASGSLENGISSFIINGSSGTLVNVNNIRDNQSILIGRVQSLATASVASSPYLFSTSSIENGINIFSIDVGALVNVGNVPDSSSLYLNGDSFITTANVGGTNYLFAVSFLDSGISVFEINENGTLRNVQNRDNRIRILIISIGLISLLILCRGVRVSGCQDIGVSGWKLF